VSKVSAFGGSHVDVGVLSARKHSLKFSFLEFLVHPSVAVQIKDFCL
jgi:hypothetical protein